MHERFISCQFVSITIPTFDDHQFLNFDEKFICILEWYQKYKHTHAQWQTVKCEGCGGDDDRGRIKCFGKTKLKSFRSKCADPKSLYEMVFYEFLWK